MTTDKVSTLHNGYCELGEGPTFDPETNIAWWFDITGCKLFEHRFDAGQTIAHDLPRMASVVAKIDRNRQLLAMENGLYIRTIETGSLVLRQPLEADNNITRSNDGRTHPSGTLWIGTMGKNAEKYAGAIYWYDGRELKTLFPNVTIPNAICFSEDGTTGYFTDTAGGKMMRVDVDPANGLPISDPDIFIDHRGNEGGLDGAIVDRDGTVWNARWGASTVDAYAPEDGRLIRSIALPASQVSCPAFCGAKGQNMIVTSAWQGQTADQRKDDPCGGQTFLIDGGFNGKFDPPFKLPE